jgi:hypothetical protein
MSIRKKPGRKKPVAASHVQSAAAATPEFVSPHESPPSVTTLSPAVPVPQSSVRVFQAYLEPWQRELIDPAFRPLDVSQQRHEAAEFAVLARLRRHAATAGAALWGVLPWRFTELTGMLGSDWVRAIDANPGADLYCCNPWPAREAVHHNLWCQGEAVHPRFLELCRAFLEAAGLPVADLSVIHPASRFAGAHCLVASPAFWDAYLSFVDRALAQAQRRMPPELRELLHRQLAQEGGLHDGSTYLSLILERLLPLFLQTEGSAFRTHRIALPEREGELNVHQRLLREMRDMASQTKSAWLAACWVNYRNLYLSQTESKDWIRQHLRAITPAEVRFG